MYGRLDKSIRPVSYKIHIDTDFSTFAFSGKEEIELKVGKPVRTITLNTRELKILGASLGSRGRTEKALVSTDEKAETTSFNFKSAVSGGVSLRIAFKGTNDHNLYGFYKSRYGKGSGKNAFVLTSQFEAATARTAFPCFDEPGFKATFELSLTVDKDLEAVSNMPVRSVKALGKGRLSPSRQRRRCRATSSIWGWGSLTRCRGASMERNCAC